MVKKITDEQKIEFAETIRELGRDLLGTGIHSGLRADCGSDAALRAYRAIREMDDGEWSGLLDRVWTKIVEKADTKSQAIVKARPKPAKPKATPKEEATDPKKAAAAKKSAATKRAAAAAKKSAVAITAAEKRSAAAIAAAKKSPFGKRAGSKRKRVYG